jgi:hypothetical protein
MQTDYTIYCKGCLEEEARHMLAEEAKYVLCEKHFKDEFLKNLKDFCDSYDENHDNYPEHEYEGKAVYDWIKEIVERSILRSKEESKPKSPKYYGEPDSK